MDRSGIFFLVATIVVAVIVFLLFNKKISKGKNFDEMQKIIRYNAYRNAFYVEVIALTVLIFVSAVIDIFQYIDTPSMLCAIMMVGMVTFAGICIYNDAFFGLDEKSSGYIVLILCIAALNLAVGILRISDGTLWENGVITFTKGGANLIMAISFAVVLVILLLRKARAKNEVTE